MTWFLEENYILALNEDILSGGMGGAARENEFMIWSGSEKGDT